MSSDGRRGLSRKGKIAVAVAVLVFTTAALGGSAYAMSLIQRPTNTLDNYVLAITSQCPFNPIAGDVGQTCNLTAVFHASCPNGSLCPTFVEVVPTPQYTVQWSFGDGQNDSGNPVSHHFPGNIVWNRCYTATVTVTDNAGNSATASIDALTGGKATC